MTIDKEIGALDDKIENDSLGDVVEELVSDMPEPSQSEHVSEIVELLDPVGNSFDSEMHQTNPDGSPKISKKGKLLRKRRASKVSVSNEKENLHSQARQSGFVAANLFINTARLIGGEEWEPKINKETGLDEKSLLENSFSDYFEMSGTVDIPPGLALAVVLLAYSVPRFTQPKTISRLSKIKSFFSKKLNRFKTNKTHEKIEKVDSSLGEEEPKK